ncbi:hypothetical protein PsorP6_013421 [Peronosclerospora sorghi]|uniref:Uncharacterized protein n=1 Tax=Peronosclerospora sorghi TaxID=230839 RepID=A0ACC0VI81_9STRA|nr:hypothetical protein PsorP6_013421 [Peronosclerospora sorghi]
MLALSSGAFESNANDWRVPVSELIGWKKLRVENADVSDQIFFILKDLVPNNIFTSCLLGPQL